MPAEPAPGQADPGYAAYEAYAMAAPDDLEFSEWEDLPEWQRKAIYAAADAAYEARAAAVAAPLNAEIASLREQLIQAQDRAGSLAAKHLAALEEQVRAEEERDKAREEAASLRRQLDAAAGSMFPKLRGRLAELEAEAARLREQLATARAERDSYRRLAVKIGDSLCSNASHAAKIRTIWELTELAPQAAADAAREALEGGGDG